jgi:xanthine/uracil permease
MDVHKEVPVSRLRGIRDSEPEQENVLLRTVKTFAGGAVLCFSVMALTASVLFFISLNRAHPVATSSVTSVVFVAVGANLLSGFLRDAFGRKAKWQSKSEAPQR